MHKLNEEVFVNSLKERCMLVGVRYDLNGSITYICERRNEEIIETNFYDLTDTRYLY